MRRLSLGTLLTGVNVGLVATTVVCVVWAAAGLLRRLADERSLAHVTLAASSAVRSIERSAEDLLVSAHLLAERPTLASLIQEQDAPALADLLRRFRRTSHLSGCAVLHQGRLLARDGMLPWEEIVRLPRDVDRPFALHPNAGGPPLLGAWSLVPAMPHSTVVVALVLDDAFAAATGKQVGLPVRILDRQQALAEALQEPLRGRALDMEGPVAERLDEAGLYLAVVPLRASTGEVIGVVETELPTTNPISSQRHFLRSLLLIAIGVGGLAVLASVLVGRRLVRPLVTLTDASARIGLGDLSTPIPRIPGTEIGALAATMEEMRGSLLHLTAKLRHRQAEAEAILTGIVEGVFSVDRERRIRYLNPQAAAILGVRPEQAIGRFCGDVLNPQGPGGVRPCEERCPIIHARFRGRARATEDLLLSSGARRSVVITSAPADADRHGDAAGADAEIEGVRQFQVMRDETDVEATRRLRDTVLANITHEFRTPLTAQLASIELLRDRLGELKAGDARDLILSLERGTLRLTQLIDNLLESVRIDAGHDSIRRQPVALEDVVDEAVDLARPLLALREQKLHVDVPFPLPSVSGDTPRLVQVFVNLLSNANKFAPPGSTISIGGEVRDHEVALWVEDEGPGLPQEAGDRLFERFMRSPGQEPPESGVGLGLWIVKSIVERHGGRVEARDRSGAPGTRIWVFLPVGGRG
jgi:signal transduction histidine kinase/HAMP domain-containing protein